VAEADYDQMCFTQGELDPRTQARVDWQQYYKAAKTISNCLVIPQGGVQRRFGLTYVDAVVGNPANPLFNELSTITFEDTTLYLLSWTATNINIYLENFLVAQVVTPYNKEDIPNLRFAQVENRVIVANPNFNPYQLIRNADAANLIAGFSAINNTLTVTIPYPVGIILPATFTTTGALPTTNPQIYAGVGRYYFVKFVTATTIQIFSTPDDAFNNVNAYIITNAGAGVNNLFTHNTWTFPAVTFKFIPPYDFNDGYNAITFTPSAVTGNITLTASAPIFTAAMVGGLYTGNGGILRITGFTDTTHVTGYTVSDFASTNAILGTLSFLGEPAWSNNRGWPRTVSFFQNRLVFGGTPAIPNGVWLSVVNDAFDFDDSETLADNAISWYPASGSQSFIRAITACRSLIFHTNTGTYSTPVTNEVPLTPTNFTLTEQNKFGCSTIQPVFIDNQILFTDLSGNNVIVMLWEITQSSYVTNNKSVPSSILIQHPVDMAALAVPDFTDGFYALFVNEDGTLAILQTLLEQEVQAWTLQTTVQQAWNGIAGDQTTGKFFRVQVAENRCWFTVQRLMPVAQAPDAIVGANPALNTLQANAHGMTVGVPTLISFTTTGVLPLTNPPLSLTSFFWAKATDANNFSVYGTESDAINNINVFAVINPGVNSNLIVYQYQNQLFIEELDFNSQMDSAVTYTNLPAPVTVLTGLDHLDGQYVQVLGDGYVLQNNFVLNGQITVETPVTNAQVGIQFVSTLTPLPVTLPQTFGLLYRPKHIRKLMVHVYETLGITVQGITVPELQIQNIVIGQVPVLQTGVFEVPLMEGWNGFEFDITIQQSLPVPMTIIGISYRLEV
jgi:hypothetical protein